MVVTAPPSVREDEKQTLKGQDLLLSHCSECRCCFKGVFVQKCSFYDCYYNYCYDYLIKDLYLRKLCCKRHL